VLRRSQFRRDASLASIVIRDDQSHVLPGLGSSLRADPPISVIGFAPQKVARDRDFFWIRFSEGGLVRL
jgi:hypothetical protein